MKRSQMSLKAREAQSENGPEERKLKRLFTPVKIGNLELKNRIIMPPMIERLATNGAPNDAVKDFYSARARGGLALIVLTPGIVDISMASPIQLGIYDDSFIPGLRQFTDLIHSCGAHMGIQLMHLGRQSGEIQGYKPVGPSPIPVTPRDEVPRELTTGEVDGLVEEFAEAARRARDAGFDMVELHGCHGYLLSSFLSPLTNKRSDKYGGSVAKRARFVVEIVKLIKEKVGQDFPVSVRMNGSDYMPGGTTVDMARQTAKLLEEAGADMIGVSGGAYGSYPVIVPPYDQPRGCNVPLAAAVKEVVKVPVAVAGRLDDPFVADEVLLSGKADVIAMARGLLADPELPNKAARGDFKGIRRCIACNVCIDGDPTPVSPITCTVNPEAGREREMVITPAPLPKRVVVIGGGLAGLEAARVAAARGHQVTLYEENAELGGQWLLASKPPHKEDHLLLLGYLVEQLDRLGVERKYGVRVTAALVEGARPDVVLVATGAKPIVPPIPGVDRGEVVTAWDVLGGGKVGRRVLVVGGGLTGLETAEFLAEQGKEIVLVEMLKRTGADMGATIRWHLMNRTKNLNIKTFVSTQIKEVLPKGVVVVSRNGVEETWDAFDTIVLACGVRPKDELSKQIEGNVKEVHVVGDAAKAQRGLEAIRSGSEIGRKI
ncbi:MAG: FAD-dependent oxidoreductase [Dehalococcoidia bacterium]|nr:FAD-dependent oxidoreductase [Dehalococcoidia bacterium]